MYVMMMMVEGGGGGWICLDMRRKRNQWVVRYLTTSAAAVTITTGVCGDDVCVCCVGVVFVRFIERFCVTLLWSMRSDFPLPHRRNKTKSSSNGFNVVCLCCFPGRPRPAGAHPLYPFSSIVPYNIRVIFWTWTNLFGTDSRQAPGVLATSSTHSNCS